MIHDADIDDLLEFLDDMVRTGNISPREAKAAMKAAEIGIANAKKEFGEMSHQPDIHGPGRMRGNKHKASENA